MPDAVLFAAERHKQKSKDRNGVRPGRTAQGRNLAGRAAGSVKRIAMEQENVMNQESAVNPDSASNPEKEKEQLKKTEKKMKRADKSVRSYQFFLIRLAVLVLIIWVLFFFIIGVIRMPSTDMFPRIDAGDLVVYYRLDKDVKAGDVIVFETDVPEMEGKQRIVSRVIAVAGDKVEITDGKQVIVNGNVLVESNIFYPTPRYEGFVEYPLTLKDGECFVLSDSRNGGMDSRYFGPVRKEEIKGTVISIMRHNQL